MQECHWLQHYDITPTVSSHRLWGFRRPQPSGLTGLRTTNPSLMVLATFMPYHLIIATIVLQPLPLRGRRFIGMCKTSAGYFNAIEFNGYFKFRTHGPNVFCLNCGNSLTIISPSPEVTGVQIKSLHIYAYSKFSRTDLSVVANFQLLFDNRRQNHFTLGNASRSFCMGQNISHHTNIWWDEITQWTKSI